MPDSNTDLFNKELLGILQKITKDNKFIYLVGDYAYKHKNIRYFQQLPTKIVDDSTINLIELITLNKEMQKVSIIMNYYKYINQPNKHHKEYLKAVMSKGTRTKLPKWFIRWG